MYIFIYKFIMYLNYVYDLDRHGGLVTAEPHWARNENAHAVVSVRKAGKGIKEMTHTPLTSYMFS